MVGETNSGRSSAASLRLLRPQHVHDHDGTVFRAVCNLLTLAWPAGQSVHSSCGGEGDWKVNSLLPNDVMPYSKMVSPNRNLYGGFNTRRV